MYWRANVLGYLFFLGRDTGVMITGTETAGKYSAMELVNFDFGGGLPI